MTLLDNGPVPTLFDTEADLIAYQDAPRVRETDPVQSHLAADRSQRNRSVTALGVLELVHQHTWMGSELNELYRNNVANLGWKKVAWDSPRKRAGELCEDGYFRVVPPADPQHPDPERVFDITELGLALLAELRKEFGW